MINSRENNIAAPGYSTYVSDLTHGQMFNRVTGVLISTGVGAGIGAACGAIEGGLGAAPGAAIGAAVGLGIGVSVAIAIDITEFISYKSQLTNEAADELTEIFKNSSETGLQCPISFTCMFDIPVRLHTCNETFERKSLKEWVVKHGTCPITRLPVELSDIRENFTIYGKMIKNTTELLNNKEIISNLSKKQIDGYVLYKEHAQMRMKEFEKNEFKNIMNKAEESVIDYEEASRRLLSLHRAKNGFEIKK